MSVKGTSLLPCRQPLFNCKLVPPLSTRIRAAAAEQACAFDRALVRLPSKLTPRLSCKFARLLLTQPATILHACAAAAARPTGPRLPAG